MSSLRQYIRQIILETRFKQMAKSKYRDLDSYLANAPFLDEPADVDALDYDFGDNYDDDDNNVSMMAMLPVQEQLAVDLGDYFMDNKRFGSMSDGRIQPFIEVNDSVIAGKGEADKALTAANYNFEDPLHVINIQIGAMQLGLTYRDLGPSFVKKLAQVIRHELLHMNQFLKFSKGEPTQELWNEFMKDYSEAQASGWKDEPYFTSDLAASEREAYAHQIADELIDSQGPDEALKILGTNPIPHEALVDLSSSYKTVVQGLEKYDNPSIRDLLKRAKQYIKILR